MRKIINKSLIYQNKKFHKKQSDKNNQKSIKQDKSSSVMKQIKVFYNIIITNMTHSIGHHSIEQMKPIIPQVNPDQNLYPFCIVWTLLPCISWILPWIGHTGICDDKGTIYDFIGYCINVGQMAFGNPKKYVKLNISSNQIQDYLDALKQGNSQFRRKAHDLCCNNCHHHVAHVLNLVGYQGRRNWTQVSVWWICISQGKYVSWGALLLTYLPLIVIVVIIVIISLATTHKS